MKRLIIILSISISFNARAADADYPSKANCPASAKYWKKNYDGCMAGLKNAISAKKVLKADAEDGCKCVSNGVVNAPKCNELHDNATIMKQVIAVQEKCKDKFHIPKP